MNYIKIIIRDSNSGYYVPSDLFNNDDDLNKFLIECDGYVDL